MKSLDIRRHELYAIIEGLAQLLKSDIDYTVKNLKTTVYTWGVHTSCQENLDISVNKIKETLERFVTLANEHQKWIDEELSK